MNAPIYIYIYLCLLCLRLLPHSLKPDEHNQDSSWFSLLTTRRVTCVTFHVLPTLCPDVSAFFQAFVNRLAQLQVCEWFYRIHKDEAQQISADLRFQIYSIQMHAVFVRFYFLYVVLLASFDRYAFLVLGIWMLKD